MALLRRCAVEAVVVQGLLLHWWVCLYSSGGFPPAAVQTVQLLLSGCVALVQLLLWYL